MTAHTSFSNNVTPNPSAPNPSQCRDAHRDAALGANGSKNIAKQANQKHELEIDRVATIDTGRVTFNSDEPTCRSDTSRNITIATRHHAMPWQQSLRGPVSPKLMSKKWNIARRM
jgi:hypothetical protein